jgi:hypothetical protein
VILSSWALTPGPAGEILGDSRNVNILEKLLAERGGAVLDVPPPPAPATSALALILERTGITLDQLQEEVLAAQAEEAGDLARSPEVPDSAELRRILALPRRSLDSGAELAEAMSEALRAPWGQQKLRPIQALALHDIHQFGGLFGPIRVGAGKTLISYLAPAVLDAKRPLLLIPAKLRDKTRREFRALAYHWRGPHPEGFRVESYELLGRPQAGNKLDGDGRVLRPGFLERYKPDLIILDEAHKAKNERAAVTRRLKRYLAENPGCFVVAMSGTVTKRSLRDFAHIAAWCMPRTCPVPCTNKDLEAWADALDEKVNPFRRVQPGALIQFCNAEELEESRYGGEAELSAVRQAFRRRMVETPGCVATQDGELGVSLSIQALDPVREDPAVEAQFRTLRTLWETPTGIPIADGIAMWRHARTLGLGFEYRWNPQPPDEWLEARRSWAKFCRGVLKYNRRGLDSEAQVAMAVDRGLYDDAGALRRWRDIKDTFEPHTEAVWFSTEALETAEAWLEENSGIVWVEHVEFGRELARRTGLPFFASQGRDITGPAGRPGTSVEDHPPGQSMICSVQSNAEGRNLQGWATNLVMAAPPNGATWEQLLGRTHRDGQEAEEVSVHVFTGAWEHVAGFYQARRDARFTQDTTGQAQKLVYADLEFPELEAIENRPGFRWSK